MLVHDQREANILIHANRSEYIIDQFARQRQDFVYGTGEYGSTRQK